MDGDDGVRTIVLAAEHLLDLAALDETGELIEAVSQLRSDVFPLARPVEQHAQVIGLRLERGDELDLFLDAPAALEGFLRLDLIVPEVRGGGARLYLGELVLGACGFKDNSGDRRPASRDPDSGGSSHRTRKPRMPPEKSSAASVSAAQMYAARSPILP